jgi:serine/threonine protein kinase/tetratricopeptide (TPR) repeat protein
MSDVPFTEVRRIFEACLDVTAGPDRQQVLDRECGTDAQLRAEVEILLAADAADTATAQLLDQGAVARPAPVAELLPGTDVGGFRIVRRIGAGGMGTVYEAEQREPQRRVALKVMQVGGGGQAALQRFRQEARILARLQHPQIAQVHGAGVHPLGNLQVPFLAMEFVAGARDLIEHASTHRLDARARMALLASVCDAVHHGHLKGVVHRDLKPANVLVDESGRPKIIDFGIARCVDADDESAGLTRTGQLLGTLQYMAPEQFGSEATAVDARTDVWAIGVIAFELLTGRPPFDLSGQPLVEAARTVTERRAPRLSTVDRGLRGDLDTIVAHCLEIEPARRYQSALQIHDDLLAWLEHRPIRARPPSTLYQLRKFARRHRLAVALAALTVLALAAAGVLLLWQNRSLQRERNRAATVNDVLQRILTEADPFRRRGAELTVVEALDAAAGEQIGLERIGDDAVAGELHHTIGRSYYELSEYARALPHLSAAVARRRLAHGADAAATMESELAVALTRLKLGDARTAQPTLEALRERAARAPAGSQELRASIDHALAMARFAADDVPGAEALYRAVLENRRQAVGTDDPATLQTQANLGRLLVSSDRAAEAVEVLSDCRDRRAHALGQDHADTWITADLLGEALADLGEFDRAEQIHAEAAAALERLLGADHDHTFAAAFHHAKALGHLGRWQQVRDLAAPLQERCARRFGPADERTRKLASLVASAAAGLGDVEVAAAAFAQVLAVERTQRGDEHPETVNAAANHAMMLFRLEQFADADRALEPFAERALAAGEGMRSVDAYVLRVRGLARQGLGDRGGAERDLLAAARAMRRIHGPDHPATRTLEADLGALRGR